MTEKKGPFDLTIKILRKESIQLRPFETDIDSTVRVLEVAGKVDKRGADAALALLIYGARERLRKTPMLKEFLEQLRTLLKSLPDGGKK